MLTIVGNVGNLLMAETGRDFSVATGDGRMRESVSEYTGSVNI